MPSVSPLATDMLTCCTALTMPRLVANSTVRSLTSSSGGAVIAESPRERRAPSPRSCGERVGVRGFFELQILNAWLAPHPDCFAVRPLPVSTGRGERKRRFRKHRSPSRPSLRIDDIAETIAEQVEAEHRDHQGQAREQRDPPFARDHEARAFRDHDAPFRGRRPHPEPDERQSDRKSTRLNSSHGYISYAVFCL